MSGIQRRVIFIGKGSDGYNRISDWCRVTTGIGAMIEPFSFNRQRCVPAADFDWKEAGNRIDEIQTYDPGCQIFDDGTTGGPTIPINGY
jgi:hypothetical protein